MVVPLVYAAHRPDSAWKNPIADYRTDNDTVLSTPQQVLISIADDTSVVVSFVTFNVIDAEKAGSVEVAGRTFTGTARYFVDAPECPGVARVMHTILVNLSGISTTPLSYTVEYNGRRRQMEGLRLPPVSAAPEGMRVAMFGDMGTHSYGQHRDLSSAPLMEDMVVSRQLDMAIHIGDLAYNLDDDCGRIGDAFMIDIEGIASRVPYMVGPGNHEAEKWEMMSYNHYLHRYNGQRYVAEKSGSQSVRWYSFNRGGVHFVVLDADPWVMRLTFNVARKQTVWLRRDLAKVNRTETPWLVVLLHRALYCTKSTDSECNEESQNLRTGDAYWFSPEGLEPLFLQHGVDLVMSGHTHHYERTYPLARGKVMPGMNGMYANPKGIVHVQSGVGGSTSTDRFTVPQAPFEAFRDMQYRRGFAIGDFHNASHLTVTQVDTTGKVVDTFTLQRDVHSPFE